MNYDEFNKNYNNFLKYIVEIQEKMDLSVGIIDTLKIKRELVKLDNRFIELFGNTGVKVIQLINSDELKKKHDSTLIISDINDKLESLKNIIKDLKIRYIRKYNAIVENTNKKINELKKLTNVSPEVGTRIQKLKEFSVYNVQKNFAFNNQLGSIKNAKAIEVINEIEDIDRIINTDIFVLNDLVVKLEKALDSLEHEVLNKDVIIDKENRKKIDLIIDKCEKELEICEEYIETRENKDDVVKLKINKLREKLTNTSIMYRGKCPLLVKKWKSAKELYQKNEKLPLIALGVSSLALVDFVVGPVIIPATMCGNLMLARKDPKFGKTITGVNKVLARVIDAKEYNDGYKLHTGVELNEEVASVSILKSIAIHEGREWLVPLVYDAKTLFEKMKLARLKDNISKGISNVSDKVNTSVKKVRQNRSVRNNLIEIKKLFNEFQHSRLSMDDFCKHNNVSITDRVMLEAFERKVMR